MGRRMSELHSRMNRMRRLERRRQNGRPRQVRCMWQHMKWPTVQRMSERSGQRMRLRLRANGSLSIETIEQRNKFRLRIKILYFRMCSQIIHSRIHSVIHHYKYAMFSLKMTLDNRKFLLGAAYEVANGAAA